MAGVTSSATSLAVVTDSAVRKRADGRRVRGLRRLPKTPTGGTLTPPTTSVSVLSFRARSGLSVRATAKGGKSVEVSVFFSPASFLRVASVSFFAATSSSLFSEAVGRCFRRRKGRLLATLKLNLGLKVVTLGVVVVVVVAGGVLDKGGRKPSVVSSGWKGGVCSSTRVEVSVGGRNGEKPGLGSDCGCEDEGFWGFLNEGIRERGRCLGFFSISG